ncbi:MAG: pyridoxamine 5'-phosphate oxidase family protein [Ilumatobacteraceae bacterium]
MVDPSRPGPASERVRVRRGAIRAEYDHATILAVLDAGMIAHVGVSTADGPIVLPMAYGHDGEQLFLHGAVANAALQEAVGNDVCVTITIVDGLVVGRCPFHNSMNYRGVIVRGTARHVVDDAERLVALRTISDHIVATWATGRAPSATELRRTTVVSVPLREASAKLRVGDPIDEPEDLDGPHWAGHVPVRSTWERPVSSADLPAGVEVPAAIATLAGRPI